MITRKCDICGEVISQLAPVAVLHVPIATSDTARECIPMGGHYRAFDICFGCVRGLVRLQPSEQRALEETERITADRQL